MAGWPLALNPGANQYTGPTCGAKKCFIAAAVADNITNTVNKGRQAWPMSSLFLLDVYVSNTRKTQGLNLLCAISLRWKEELTGAEISWSFGSPVNKATF